MSEKRSGYLYSFRCGEEIEYFNRLPDDLQANIEQYIVRVIRDSFVRPADEDYIAARLLAQKRMCRAFFWAASQSIEKYLKAFLLMRGVSVNEFKGHPIADLYAKACLIDPEFSAIDTNFHSAIKFHPNALVSIKQPPAEELIKKIEAHGSPDNRYNSFGVDFNSGYLFALDGFIFGLRQQIGIPPIQETLKKVDASLVEAFNLYNPWFSTENIDLAEMPNENFNLNISSSSTTLDFLISPSAPSGSRFALQWLNRKMKLPSKVKKYLKRS